MCSKAKDLLIEIIFHVWKSEICQKAEHELQGKFEAACIFPE